ncbi:hypothetical protein cand_002040 [Cryptosporidium andersoni]|uniref:Origin recognition complex subunit 1 n=1 Tax=Cryptosporidium andersoni TaxID=117008 RepID=A0A1J4MTV7_9CRYT|nr:hypothetical protein cand_002040 [Cryptosporidium andersoni]
MNNGKFNKFKLKLNYELKDLGGILLKDDCSGDKFSKQDGLRRCVCNSHYINKDLKLDCFSNNSKTRRKHRKIDLDNDLLFPKLLPSPIITPQGYHLYLYYFIEDETCINIFTIGDYVMINLTDGKERPAQLMSFLYDPNIDLIGVEVRWLYSEYDILEFENIIDKSKWPHDLFQYEEEYIESDKCEIFDANVIKRMIRVWNNKEQYLDWANDRINIYSGPQCLNLKKKVKNKNNNGKKVLNILKYHDDLLIDYIRDFNEDILPSSIEVYDNYISIYILMTSSGTIIPIDPNRYLPFFLMKCSHYYSYYINYFKLRDSQIKYNDLEFYNKVGIDNLHWSKKPQEILPCRKSQHDEITKYLKSSIMAKGGGVLFIAGLPGTGKTATVLNVLNMLDYEEKQKLLYSNNKKIIQKHSFIWCYINVLYLSNPDHLYISILQQLYSCNNWAPTKDSCYTSLDQFFKSNNSPVTIIVIDEIDWLQKNGCSSLLSDYKTSPLLYNLIDWPFQKNTKVIIIAIANTMDLPERLIPRCTSRCGYARINFKPFTVEEMVTILLNRLESSNISYDKFKQNISNLFCPKALEFCARKVAQQSSDVRRALQILQRAWEISVTEYKKSKNDLSSNNINEEKVTINHVQQACKEVLLVNPIYNFIESLPIIPRMFLAAIYLEIEYNNKDNSSNSNLNCHLISLERLELRLKTILSLTEICEDSLLTFHYLRSIIKKFVECRIIKVFKDINYNHSNNVNSYSQYSELGIWIYLLIESTQLKQILLKSIPYTIPGLTT